MKKKLLLWLQQHSGFMRVHEGQVNVFPPGSYQGACVLVEPCVSKTLASTKISLWILTVSAFVLFDHIFELGVYYPSHTILCPSEDTDRGSAFWVQEGMRESGGSVSGVCVCVQGIVEHGKICRCFPMLSHVTRGGSQILYNRRVQ